MICTKSVGRNEGSWESKSVRERKNDERKKRGTQSQTTCCRRPALVSMCFVPCPPPYIHPPCVAPTATPTPPRERRKICRNPGLAGSLAQSLHRSLRSGPLPNPRGKTWDMARERCIFVRVHSSHTPILACPTCRNPKSLRTRSGAESRPERAYYSCRCCLSLYDGFTV